MNRISRCCYSLLVLSCCALVGAEAPILNPLRKAAIFVENRAGAALNEKVQVLEDLVTSRITEKGFSVISREVAISALNNYPNVGVAVDTKDPIDFKVDLPTRGTKATGEKAKTTEGQVSVRPGPTKLDQILSDDTSALRLAQNLGADYLLVASITSLGTERKNFKDGAITTANVIHTLRVSYKVLEGLQGGTLIGDTIKISRTIRVTENSQTENSDIVNELLDEAALQVADNAGRKQALVADAPAKPGLVEIVVSCGMQDLVDLRTSLPDIRVRDDGTLLIHANPLPIQVLDATVEVNGLSVGSAPGKFKVPPGLNKMRITREGFKDWERTVNLSEGQKFNVALQMSAAGYARWKDNTAFLFGLKTGEKLTDGLREMMAGFAQTLRQSGYRIDHQADIKANIEAKGKSLFDGLIIQPTLFK